MTVRAIIAAVRVGAYTLHQRNLFANANKTPGLRDRDAQPARLFSGNEGA